MPGLMQWRSRNTSDYTKILWVQEPGQAWQPYTTMPRHIPDGQFMGVRHSEGWAMMQHLKSLGWTLIASDPQENATEERREKKLMPLSGLSEAQRQRWSA